MALMQGQIRLFMDAQPPQSPWSKLLSWCNMDFSSSLGVPCLGACVARADRTLGANEETGAEGAAAAASAAQGPNVVRPAQLASVHAPAKHKCHRPAH
eukprot:1160726-Pelagomonas_calceolata.AAC.6